MYMMLGGCTTSIYTKVTQEHEDPAKWRTQEWHSANAAWAPSQPAHEIRCSTGARSQAGSAGEQAAAGVRQDRALQRTFSRRGT